MKSELLFGGIAVSSIIVLFVVALSPVISGNYLFDYSGYEIPEAVSKAVAIASPMAPVIRQPRAFSYIPSIEELAPEEMQLFVNAIPVPLLPLYNFIPLKEDRIRTFSGRFGPYAKDTSEYLRVYLCAYAYKVPNAPLECEEVQTVFQGGYLAFFRGYAPDEFINRQALRNFGVMYFVMNDQYGVVASSNIGIVRLVND